MQMSVIRFVYVTSEVGKSIISTSDEGLFLNFAKHLWLDQLIVSSLVVNFFPLRTYEKQWSQRLVQLEALWKINFCLKIQNCDPDLFSHVKSFEIVIFRKARVKHLELKKAWSLRRESQSNLVWESTLLQILAILSKHCGFFVNCDNLKKQWIIWRKFIQQKISLIETWNLVFIYVLYFKTMSTILFSGSEKCFNSDRKNERFLNLISRTIWLVQDIGKNDVIFER